MKKTIAILLSVLFCVLFTACAQREDGSHNGPESQSVSATAGDGERPSLTVLCDFPNQNPGGYIGEALLGIPGMDDYELLMEYVPDKEPERSNYITRTNVELMSGKGADVFIADCYMGNLLTDVEGPLFNYPEKLMENHISVDDQLIVVPGSNRTGGVTAGVESYGAVNRNTKQPEMAFAVLDKLLSQSNQQNNEMFFLLSGMPVDTELGGADSRFMWANSWFMNDWNFDQYKAVRDRIDSVKFYTPLDQEAENILLEACEAEDATEDSIRRAVHKCYTTMEMMLAES